MLAHVDGVAATAPSAAAGSGVVWIGLGLAIAALIGVAVYLMIARGESRTGETTVAATEPARATVPAPEPAPQPAPEPAPAPPAHPEQAEGEARSAPKGPSAHPDRAEGDARSAPQAPTPAPPTPKPRLTELELIERARVALHAGDHRAALRTTEMHARVYAAGVLSEEREAIAIEALIELGAIESARERLAAFGRRFPSSGYRQRLRELAR
jgi:hypothetical protein